ncbi:MAG: EamA family transporter [Burkholderiaceae bacterium]
MSATALALVIAAALLHSVWNIVAKKAGGDDRFALITALLLITLWAPVGVWACWGVLPGWGWLEWSVLLVSAIVHLVYFTTLLRGYRLSDLTVVYPLARGTGPLLSSLGAVLLLGEPLSLVGVLGVAAVTLGVFFIAGGPALWAKVHDPLQRERVRAGLAYGAATGALIAGYTLIDGYAVKVLLLSPIVVDYVGNLFRVPFLLPAALRDPAGFKRAWHTQWRYALVVAVLGPLAYVLVLYAVRLAPLSHVAPAREVSMLFAALIGGRLLGEGERGLRIAGAACIAAGVAALALG